MSEAGVHRPHVAGIHGREDEGSYSIVLSGGYEDDKVYKVQGGIKTLSASIFHWNLKLD